MPWMTLVCLQEVAEYMELIVQCCSHISKVLLAHLKWVSPGRESDAAVCGIWQRPSGLRLDQAGCAWTAARLTQPACAPPTASNTFSYLCTEMACGRSQ